jgi:signal transduction histidine kinase
LAATSEHFADRAVWAFFGPVVGWSFVGTGLYAWRRRPESRFGALMILLGFAWFLAVLQAADAPLLFTLGFGLGALWGPLLAHVLLSFPTGRLQTRGQRILLAVAYPVVPLAPLPALLVSTSDDLVECEGPCPRNLLLVTRNVGLGETLLAASSAVVMTLSLIAIWMLAAKWRAAGPSGRRSLAPLYLAGATSLGFVIAYAATKVPALLTLAFVSFAVTPFAFLAGLVRADLSHSRGMRGLMARLGTLSGRDDLRDALAAALGDPGLRLAFWVPDQHRYVEASGVPAELPADGAGDRVVTEIGRDGRRVAAIVHDRDLLDDAATVRAAGAATALLLENQRLDAELRAHIVELRASRARLVEAGDTERRRLERNLHDGAQSRLVALAINLRLARAGFEDGSPAAALVEESIGEVRESLDELRELARGIHPAVLSEHGLEPAVRSLAARAPLPVEVVGGPGGRLPAAVETAAYFVVSEALANVAKYAHAGGATVRMERDDGRLLVEVSDDGVGGAAVDAGSGLRGLSDRVAALDGALDVSSPPGGGTRLRARLPCT